MYKLRKGRKEKKKEKEENSENGKKKKNRGIGIGKVNKRSKNVSKRKRTNKKRKKKYKIKPEVKLYLVVFLISLLFIVASFTFLFKIKNIYVYNCDKYAQEEIIASSQIRSGSNLLLMNKNVAKKNICESFSYIKDVKIIKKIPNSIEIYINLENPDFFIKNDDKYFLISETGKILESNYNKFDTFLEVKGLNLCNLQEDTVIHYKNEKDKECLKEIRRYIQKYFQNEICMVDMENTNKITLNYNNKIDINIGGVENINYKLLTAKEIIDNKIDKKNSGKLDVSKADSENTSYFTPLGIIN